MRAARMRGQSDSWLPEVCGGGAPARVQAEVPGTRRRRLADQDTTDSSSGSWRVRGARDGSQFLPRVSGHASSRPPAPRGLPLAVFPWLSAEETATQTGLDWAGGGRCGIRRQRMRVRAQLLFTSR